MITLAPMFDAVWRICGPAVRAASAYTFAIYLLHFPILKFLAVASATAGLGTLRFPVIVVLSFLSIAVLNGACDRLKPVLKKRLQDGFGKLASVRAATAEPGPRKVASKSAGRVRL
jgi:peptidoglycan/LPS O-acetylase OafA/YrhL